MSSLSRYLAELEVTLGHLDDATRREIIEEARGHIEDKARHFQLRELSKEEAMSKAIEGFGEAKEIGSEMREVYESGTKGEALLAALPPLLFGLAIALLFLLVVPLDRLVIGGATQGIRLGKVDQTRLSIGLGVGTGVVALLVLVALYAAWRRLPLWGYTWTGAAVMGILFALMVASDDLPCLVSPVIDVLILIALLLMMGAALGAAGWRGPLLGGLAGLSTTMILSLVVVSWASAAPFSRLDIALLAGPLGLVYSGLLYGFMTGPPARRAALLAVGGLLCLGTMGGVEYGLFWQWQSNHGQTGQIWTLLAVGVALLALGPTVGLMAQRLRPRAA